MQVLTMHPLFQLQISAKLGRMIQNYSRLSSFYSMITSLPDDEIQARKVVVQPCHFAIIDSVLYFVDSKNDVHCFQTSLHTTTRGKPVGQWQDIF